MCRMGGYDMWEEREILGSGGTGSVCCRSICVLHLSHFLNQEDLMEREAMVQNP
jgi:hypothetical protein